MIDSHITHNSCARTVAYWAGPSVQMGHRAPPLVPEWSPVTRHEGAMPSLPRVGV